MSEYADELEIMKTMTQDEYVAHVKRYIKLLLLHTFGKINENDILIYLFIYCCGGYAFEGKVVVSREVLLLTEE